MIKATATRRAHGWHAVLEFPNGGRQVYTSQHGTMDSAIVEARQILSARSMYPNSAVRDPRAHELMDFNVVCADFSKIELAIVTDMIKRGEPVPSHESHA